MNKFARFISVKRNKIIVAAIILVLDLVLSYFIFVSDQDPNKDWIEILFWAVVNPGTILLLVLVFLLPVSIIKFFIKKMR